MAEESETIELITCKGCNEQFVSILKHLNKNKLSNATVKCLSKYNEADIHELRKRAKVISLKKRKLWKKANKEHISAYNCVNYHEKYKEKISQRNKLNKKSIAERDQKRYAKKKAEKAELRHQEHVQSQTESLERFKISLPKERRQQNQFEKRMIDRRKPIIESLTLKVMSEDAKKCLEDTAILINETLTKFESEISEIELEVKDFDINQWSLFFEKYNRLKDAIYKRWHSVEDKLDNTLKELTFKIGESFQCPRCIPTDPLNERCFYCQRGFKKYDFKLYKKHKHPPSVCRKKCNAREEISEYEKIREENIASLRKNL